MLKVGLPKGRLQEKILRKLNTGDLGETLKDRTYRETAGEYDLYLLKPKSIPQLVSLGFLDVGIVGRDLLENSIYANLREHTNLHMHPVKIVVAAKDPKFFLNPPERPINVATEYPILASKWLSRQGYSHIIIETFGSTEAYVPSFADIIIDVVETGDTLKANGLHKVRTVLLSDTIIITRTGDEKIEGLENLRRLLQSDLEYLSEVNPQGRYLRGPFKGSYQGAPFTKHPLSKSRKHNPFTHEPLKEDHPVCEGCKLVFGCGHWADNNSGWFEMDSSPTCPPASIINNKHYCSEDCYHYAEGKGQYASATSR